MTRTDDTLTVSDFLEAHSDALQIGDDNVISIVPEMESAMQIALLAMFNTEHALIAGVNSHPNILPFHQYRVLQKINEHAPNDLVVERIHESGSVVLLNVMEFINAFADNVLPGGEEGQSQVKPPQLEHGSQATC